LILCGCGEMRKLPLLHHPSEGKEKEKGLTYEATTPIFFLSCIGKEEGKRDYLFLGGGIERGGLLFLDQDAEKKERSHGAGREEEKDDHPGAPSAGCRPGKSSGAALFLAPGGRGGLPTVWHRAERGKMGEEEERCRPSADLKRERRDGRGPVSRGRPRGRGKNLPGREREEEMSMPNPHDAEGLAGRKK